jgi:hypothetical protein
MIVMLVLLMEGIYEMRLSFLKIGKGVQAILSVCLSNLIGCNVDITDEGIYDVHRSNGLRLHDIRTKFYDDRFRNLSNITDIIATISEAVMLVLLIEGIC